MSINTCPSSSYSFLFLHAYIFFYAKTGVRLQNINQEVVMTISIQTFCPIINTGLSTMKFPLWAKQIFAPHLQGRPLNCVQ